LSYLLSPNLLLVCASRKDSTLLTPVEVLPADADLVPVVVRLVAEMDPLRAEIAQLRRDNLELRQQAGYWHSRHAYAVKRLVTASSGRFWSVVILTMCPI
jgi:hypothetical protein